MTRKIEIPNLDNLLERYKAGEPEQKLAHEAGVNRWTFRQRIIKAGITPRNISDSMLIRWSEATAEARDNMLKNAHIAASGRTITHTEKRQRAITVEKRGSHISPIETVFADWIRNAGYSITQQKAVGIYNLDIALNEFPIAIEIFGGGWHNAGDHRTRFFERTEYLINSGISVLIIWVDCRRFPLNVPACGEKIVTFINSISRYPSALGKYEVIVSDGNIAPANKTYFNSPAIIERLRSSFDTANSPNNISW